MKARSSKKVRRSRLEQELCASIAQRFGGAITLLNAAFAERMGMNTTDFRCLAILLQEGPITAGRLSELARMSSAATTQVVDRLERVGVVRRERDPDDRRRVILRAVRDAKLEGDLAGHQADLVRAMTAVTGGYSDRELATMREFLDRASEAMQAIADQVHGAVRQGGSPEQSRRRRV